MDIVTKKQLNILVQLAEVDKHFAKSERDLITKIARDRNFAEEDLAEIIRNPEPIGTLGALSIDQKFNYLMACVHLIFADHKVFENELTFGKSIAYKLGFKKGALEFLIENYEKLPPDLLKNKLISDYNNP